MSNPLPRPSLLIIDDDPLIREGLALALGNDFTIHQAESRASAISVLRKLPSPLQLALVDLGLPPFPHRPDEGFLLIAELLAHEPTIKIFVLSGQNDLSNARHARAMGAIDFIAKPCSPERIKQHFENALSIQQSPLNEPHISTITQRDQLFGIVGQSDRIKALRDQILMYAALSFPVLIEGESGSGKELVATAIQNNSPEPDTPFKVLNCAAIAPTLIEPTLFGYSKGAFTGAISAQSGFFEDASAGTLFLDEIGELPLELQTKLLRVLENGEYQRVGETTTRISRARIIAATNRNMRDAVRDGSFRSDLYHRLNVFHITVPPLRELGRDKILLLDYFRSHFSRQINQAPFNLSHEAMQSWERYNFPGNNRELRNIVVRLSTKYAGKLISASELQDEFDPFESSGDRSKSESTPIKRFPPTSAGEPFSNTISPDTDSETGITRRFAIHDIRNQISAGNFNLDQHLREQEACYISTALELTAGNISEAARLLGINRTTLHSRLGTLEKLKQ